MVSLRGGSSGSGIFNDQGQLMGQLYGVSCPARHGEDCVNSGCNNRDQYNKVYGKFSVTFPLIQRWLEIGGTIQVDRNYNGAELGTPSQPFRTVKAAYDFAWDGARIKIKAGDYPERLTFSKRVTVIASGGTATGGPQ